MRLLAIDPGSNKCGVAFFHNGVLKKTTTLLTDADTPLTRRLAIARQVFSLFEQNEIAVSEEPLLLGRNNNGMQRLLGMFEYGNPRINFVHPMSVKKFCGSGKLDKVEVALAVGNCLKSEAEKEILADAIAREAWDETDAVAIGLTYMEKNK